MNIVPPPETFKDALRLLYSRYLLAAGIALGIGGAAIVLYLMFFTPANLASVVVNLLGRALLGAGIAQTLVIIFLGLGGPVRSFKGSLGKASIDTSGDDS